MTLHKPWIMQPVIADPDLTYTAQEIRMSMTGVAIIEGQGVIGSSDFLVVQRGAGANFSVDVGAGVAGTVGDDIAFQGTYFTWNDATVNVVTPGAPGSGTRVHRLVLQIRDKLSNGSFTTYDAVLSLLQDVGGGTPAEPASALTLALISISSGQVSVTNTNVADKRFVWTPPKAGIKAGLTSRATTSLTADPDLQVAVDANATYEVTFLGMYDGVAAANMVVQWGTPAGSSFLAGSLMAALNAAGVSNLVFPPPETLPAAVAVGGSSAGARQNVFEKGILITGNTPGTFSLVWAQQVSNATPTILHAGSALILRRIA
jgi:hypothetical protein